jgi:hypothetical protein
MFNRLFALSFIALAAGCSSHLDAHSTTRVGDPDDQRAQVLGAFDQLPSSASTARLLYSYQAQADQLDFRAQTETAHGPRTEAVLRLLTFLDHPACTLELEAYVLDHAATQLANQLYAFQSQLSSSTRPPSGGIAWTWLEIGTVLDDAGFDLADLRDLFGDDRFELAYAGDEDALETLAAESYGRLVQSLAGSDDDPDTTVLTFDLERNQAGQGTVDVPPGRTGAVVAMHGAGDADLYVAQGRVPTWSDFDCRPYRRGSEERCTFGELTHDELYVLVRGFDDAEVEVRVVFD